MPVNKEVYLEISTALKEKHVALVAVSKTKLANEIKDLYDLGQKDFGENYVQELVDKYQELPKDINWHFIGHLQSNKVKYIAPFVNLIHGVDSMKLLQEIDKQAARNNRIINVLLQMHIASEETKFGMDEAELDGVMAKLSEEPLNNIKVVGLMGMASFTSDQEKVRNEFRFLKSVFDQWPNFTILSMGMSGDYQIAIDEASTMVRIGSLIFGERRKGSE